MVDPESSVPDSHEGGDSEDDDFIGSKNKSTWSISDRLKAASIIATFVISLASIGVSLLAHKTSSDNAQAIESSRVETGANITNSNYSDYANPWEPWEEPITPTTTFVGLQRQIFFDRPFNKAPKVTTAFSIVDTASLLDVLRLLNYPASHELSQLESVHLISMTTAVTEKGFILQVGIGLRRVPAEFLVGRLQSAAVDPTLIQSMLRNAQLADRTDLTLSRREIWLVNFYSMVGSLQATWIAQDREK